MTTSPGRSSEMLSIVKPNVKYNDKFKLQDALKKINSIVDTFDEESAKFHEQYFKHGKVEGRDDIVPYDAIEENAHTMLHYLMFIYNALCQSDGNALTLEDFLCEMASEKQIFSREEIKSM